MGKMIAVWGTPNSGKTTIAMKLAESLYLQEKRRKLMIMVVFTDVTTPAVPVVFPNYRDEEVYSVGALLAKTNLTVDDVFSYTTFTHGKDNQGFLGYKGTENSHSHPAYTKEKAELMFDILKANTDYVLVDCMNCPKDSLMTEIALKKADSVIWAATPDLKSISYMLSQKSVLTAQGFMRPEMMIVVNTNFPDCAMPPDAAKANMGHVDFALPYSSALSLQMMEGSIGENLKDRKYMKAVSMIAAKVR
jgi:MinD superfamily P-loop ATPase